jgi:hypothetical protein
MKPAAATMKGFEVMRMIRRGHCLTCKPHVKDEVRLVTSCSTSSISLPDVNRATDELRPTELLQQSPIVAPMPASSNFDQS